VASTSALDRVAPARVEEKPESKRLKPGGQARLWRILTLA
jgi:hypothetical protein